MDINRIREFLVLSRELNYSRAANQLYITQPVLSRHIHDLEETFGGRLFIRDTHSVRLTDFGELCAEHLQEALKSYDRALTQIRAAADTSGDTLSIGFLDHAVRPFLNQFAAWFAEAHPNIEIDYISGDLDDLADSVLDDRADLAFVTHVGSDPSLMKELDSERINEDRLLATLPPAHPFGGRDSISIAELSTQPLITFSRATNPYTADFHASLFDSRNLSTNVVKTVSNVESGLFYVKTGIGAFMIPRHLSALADDLSTVMISDDDCRMPLYLIWKKRNPKQSLQTYVRDFKMFYRNR